MKNKLIMGAKILFLVVGVLSVYEFLFVQGMFTAPLMMLITLVVGLVNVVISAISKNFMEAALYALSTVALTMGIAQILFM